MAEPCCILLTVHDPLQRPSLPMAAAKAPAAVPSAPGPRSMVCVLLLYACTSTSSDLLLRPAGGPLASAAPPPNRERRSDRLRVCMLSI